MTPYCGDRKTVRIHIGDCHVSPHPTAIQTVLGSCVAVCIFDPVSRVGGMNHILLPGRVDSRRFDDTGRYAVNAMEILINRIMKAGGDRHRLTAKVFGGASLFEALSGSRCMGRQNVAFAVDFLEREGIPLAARSTGGDQGRLIHFFTDTGDVYQKRLRSTAPFRIVSRELEQVRKVRKDAGQPADVQLFNR